MSNAQNSPGKEAGLEEKYQQLQADHYQLEDEHFALQHQLRRVRRCYRLFFLLLLIIGIGGGMYFWREKLSSLLPGNSDQAQQNQGAKEDLVTVERQTLRNTLSLT
ncbi:MAG: hypothetical protein D3906_15085, partial [Candidatus Electrothrix sp. AUS1_2]|nr:hypothetical protein [Candidatus Electrothrix sp. AUS1_2]